jgi:hypothetical protein
VLFKCESRLWPCDTLGVLSSRSFLDVALHFDSQTSAGPPRYVKYLAFALLAEYLKHCTPHMHVCMYACISSTAHHICMYACACVWIYVLGTFVYIYMLERVCVNMPIQFTYIHMCSSNTYIPTYLHTNIRCLCDVCMYICVYE